MKYKFEEFYFENDKTYSSEVYWNLYDKDHKAAIKKYEGHIFCPLCRLAPLTVAKGNLRRYFKVIESDIEKHDSKCSYRRKKGTKKETEWFYRDLDTTDIRNRLISCMNIMLKKTKSVTGGNGNTGNKKSEYTNNFLNFTTNGGEIKHLPHKNFNAKTLEDDMDVQKVYYGKCALYIKKYILHEKNEIKKYYLKVLHQDTKKQICDISISPYVYKYLESDFKLITEEKDKAENFYLCFSGILEKGEYSYKCKLQDSRLIVIEKE